MKRRRTPISRLKRPENRSRETLERMKRWPSIALHWTDRKVRIWSGEWQAYWRPGGAGYTSDGMEAGVYDFEDAWRRSCHCDPSKRIEYCLTEDGTSAQT